MLIRSSCFITRTWTFTHGKNWKLIYISLLTWQSSFLVSVLNIAAPSLMITVNKTDRQTALNGFQHAN